MPTSVGTSARSQPPRSTPEFFNRIGRQHPLVKSQPVLGGIGELRNLLIWLCGALSRGREDEKRRVPLTARMRRTGDADCAMGAQACAGMGALETGCDRLIRGQVALRVQIRRRLEEKS